MSVAKKEGYARLEAYRGFSAMKIRPFVGLGSTRRFKPEIETDDPEAVRQGDFEYDFLPGAKKNLSVDFIHSTDKAPSYWYAPIEFLWEIVEELGVTYPQNHPTKPGMVIKPNEVNPGNFQDPFFNEIQSNMLYSRRMEGGTYMLNLADPLDRLFFYSYKHNPTVWVKDGTEISDYLLNDIKFLLFLPGVEKKEKAAKENLDIEAVTLLHKDKGIGFDKQLMVARIMSLPGVDFTSTDPDEIRVMLKSEVAQNYSFSNKWQCTIQEKFVELATMDNEDLTVLSYIRKAIDYNVVIKRSDYFVFEGEAIEGPQNETELLEFLRMQIHQSLYYRIMEKVEEADAQALGKLPG